MRKKLIHIVSALIVLSLFLSGCGGDSSGKTGSSAGDEQYESQTITITGAGLEKDLKISVSELRSLPQHSLEASYLRTTGLNEEYRMEGPYLSEVFDYLGLDLSKYAALGVEGSDGYYCLIPADIISATPDLMVALTIDGQSVLGEDKAPAVLGVQGQFGPYWVKMISKITVYTEIPEKEITSVWVFKNLVSGIEPYYYEYYGGKDASVEFSQILSRFDSVNGESFLTMKSSDGFLKNETINMVNHGYYIKYEGADSPTNVSVNIKLGMNVQNIAWFSTNADAVVFPEELDIYMDRKTIGGYTGILLSEILFEAGVRQLSGVMFDILGVNGEKITVDGSSLYDAVLYSDGDGTYSVIWDPSLGLDNIANLMRVRVSSNQTADAGQTTGDNASGGTETSADGSGTGETPKPGDSGGTTAPKDDVKTSDDIITVTGDGVSRTSYWSLSELKELNATGTVSYSSVNNWPTRKTYYASGVMLKSLLEAAGISTSSGTIKITASDGAYATLTYGQAMSEQWSYPNIAGVSSDGAFHVPSILAWSCYESGESPSDSDKLRLVVGQRGINDVNTSVWLSDVVEISVSSSGASAWNSPVPSLEPGQVESGSLLSFNYDYLNRVKIYYTTDGSDPNYESSVYNPSTTNFQPKLIAPIKIDRDMTVKILVSGWGRPDSAVYSFTYTTATASSAEAGS